jgi:hypothetical protein
MMLGAGAMRKRDAEKWESVFRSNRATTREFMRKSVGLMSSRSMILHSSARDLHVLDRAIVPGALGAKPSVAFEKRGIEL